MDNHCEVTNWFKRMGYDGEIPESLGNIYNNSTSFIWEQLIQSAKPKQEVDNLRNNIIIHRLRSKAFNQQDEFSYPIEEIELYIKKQSLENKLNNLKSVVNEKRHKLNNMAQNNKMKYVTIERLNSKIKGNEEREYLLSKRCEMLETNIHDAEETLTCAKNLTPVELDENPNTKEITETLQKCAEKLEKLIQNIPNPSKNASSAQKFVRPFQSVQKHPKAQSTFERYLVMSEKKYSTKLKVLRQAQSTMEIEENNKENEVAPKKINVNLFSDNQPNDKKNTRESLGILPDSYLKDKNDFNFLTAYGSDEDLFSSPLCGFNKKNTSSPPFITCRKQSSALDIRSFCSNIETTRSSNPPQKTLSFEELYNNEFVIKQLKTLLYNHNRQIIWNTIQTLNDNLNSEVTRHITFESEWNDRNKSVNHDDIAKLQFLHIQTELQTLKLKAVSKDLSNKIDRKKKQIYACIVKKVSSPERMLSVERLLEKHLMDIGLDVVLVEMKKEINSAKKFEESSDLQITLGKTKQVKDDIVQKISAIKQYINSIYETLRFTMSTREQTVACVRKLGPFVEDLTWSAPLTENRYSIETRTFEKFPLEYNRRCIHTDPRLYYRDIVNDIPTDIELDSDSTYMLTSILESPFNPPETVLLNILKSKMKLDALKSLQNYSRDIICTKYSLNELQAQESYVQYALDKLNSIIYSSSASKTLATADAMRKVMDIWVEMPLKDFISPKHVFKGKDYKFYEKQYDGFYNNFK